ncbi:protein phosphatase 2C domain-containing protein [Streptomyces sp. NPDC091292]|uniref:protein phosphatase 2C domain-containing protein n=1 Tax=Streptomyces sp. NPDC091292 TaxID=3365991 RepID=UPI00381BB3D0
MRIDIATAPGDPGRPNEDFASVAVPASGQGGSLVVLDGVTPPRDGDDGCRHSVPWFTAHLGGALGELSVSRRDLTLRDVLSEAIVRTADTHRATCDLSHPRTPQATVVLARWDAERVEHLVLSDSALLLERPDGSVDAVLDDRLARVPRAALGSAAHVDAVLRNREGGFFTAAADPTVAGRAVAGASARDEVRSLLALTDGATRWVDRFTAGDWHACHTIVRKEGTQSLIDRVRDLERSREGRAALGHSKPHDDAAAVYAEL